MFPSFCWPKRTYWRTPWSCESRWWSFFERRKRKPPKQRLPVQEKAKKDEFDIACYSGNVSSSNENTLLTTGTTDNDVTDNSIISKTEILFEKRDTDNSKKKEIFDNNSIKKTLEKTTQTYDKYCLRAKIEEIIYKNRERIRDDKIVKPGTCRTRDFSNANPMDLEKILKNKAKRKYFIALFWKKQNMLWLIAMVVSKSKINVH